jgi:phosphatidylserine/phosphatidylglycerophosphate/cardiolipin synthase-like enzyme
VAVHLTKEFLKDLRDGDDGKFVRHVLNHTVNEDGTFRPDRDDHRYEGVDDAWIRYVSRGNTAYRVIFIRKGADVFLYRAGRHKVEDDVQELKETTGAIRIHEAPIELKKAEPVVGGVTTFLKTAEPTFISKYIKSMYHLRHNEVYIVSPFIDLTILSSRHHFGRFLDKATEDGTDVVIITLPPTTDDALESFKDLEKREIDIFFLSRLHTKLYLFDVDLSSRNQYQKDRFGTAIIGSSNLTYVGMGFDDITSNEELCCALPSSFVSEMKNYVTRLTLASEDYKKFAFRWTRRRKC